MAESRALTLATGDVFSLFRRRSVAIFRLQIESVGRSTGRRATSSAAYRAGERIRDERSGNVYDHTKRTDVVHKEIVVPSRFAGVDLDWARDRSTLWNAAELAETSRNSRIAREYQVSLPHELSPPQRLHLTRAFSRAIADRYGVVVDTTIHEPPSGGDPRSYHAHLLSTTREAGASGLGAKSEIEISDTRRSQRGLKSSSDEYKSLRALWAGLTNEALREANIDARVDHRSLAAQGIDREPTPRIPIGMIRSERQGLRNEEAERIRERYRERVDARAARGSEEERGNHVTTTLRASIEDLRRKSADAWLKYRAGEKSNSAAPKAGLTRDAKPTREREKDTDAGRVLAGSRRDNDFSL